MCIAAHRSKRSRTPVAIGQSGAGRRNHVTTAGQSWWWDLKSCVVFVHGLARCLSSVKGHPCRCFVYTWSLPKIEGLVRLNICVKVVDTRDESSLIRGSSSIRCRYTVGPRAAIYLRFGNSNREKVLLPRFVSCSLAGSDRQFVCSYVRSLTRSLAHRRARFPSVKNEIYIDASWTRVPKRSTVFLVFYFYFFSPSFFISFVRPGE